MHNNLMWTQEKKKQVINLVEQMISVTLVEGKKCWMDVLVHNENEEVMEQLGSLILVINGFIVKGRPSGILEENVCSIDFLDMKLFWIKIAYEFTLTVYTRCYQFQEKKSWRL